VIASNSVGDGTASPFSDSVTPGVVRNSGFETVGYQTLQAAYNANTHTPEIQITAGAAVGPLVAGNSGTVIIKGGFDAAFSSSLGSPAVLGVVLLKAGITKMQNVIIKP
jgi:hypothetical protein